MLGWGGGRKRPKQFSGIALNNFKVFSKVSGILIPLSNLNEDKTRFPLSFAT